MWYQCSHLTLYWKAIRHISQNVELLLQIRNLICICLTENLKTLCVMKLE